MAKPQLVVRRARGGGVATPTTTTGFFAFAALGLVLSLALMVAAKRQPYMLVGLLGTLWPMRDLLAWMMATDAERARFLAEVEVVKAENPGPGERVVATGNRTVAIVSGCAGVASLLASAYLHPVLIVASLCFFAFSAANILDLVRRPPEP